jgi:hypothetical protein
MKLPFLRPVVPPHVFSLSSDGVTYANVRRERPAGFAEARTYAYPSGSLGAGASGTPLFTREALSEAVTAARRLAEDRLSRASVVFPDAWARILPMDFEQVPASPEAASEMVLWKLKKLLPGVTTSLTVAFREMVPAGEGKRLLVAAAPTETLATIEQAFGSLGVRVGLLAPASLVLFDGAVATLTAGSGGDVALVHRSAGSLTLLIARGSAPLFFRQRPSDEQAEEHEQELRLSLSYYSEKLGGSGLSAVYVHDELGTGDLSEMSAFPVAPASMNARTFGADEGFDDRIRAHPELLPAFAAVWGRG